MIFEGVNDCEYFSCFKRYGHDSKTKNVQNQSELKKNKDNLENFKKKFNTF